MHNGVCVCVCVCGEREESHFELLSIQVSNQIVFFRVSCYVMEMELNTFLNESDES